MKAKSSRWSLSFYLSLFERNLKNDDLVAGKMAGKENVSLKNANGTRLKQKRITRNESWCINNYTRILLAILSSVLRL